MESKLHTDARALTYEAVTFCFMDGRTGIAATTVTGNLEQSIDNRVCQKPGPFSETRCLSTVTIPSLQNLSNLAHQSCSIYCDTKCKTVQYSLVKSTDSVKPLAPSSSEHQIGVSSCTVSYLLFVSWVELWGIL